MSKDFLTAVKERRSIYATSKEEVIPEERIQEIIHEAVLHTPSAFNSQSARVVVLFGKQHDRLWDLTEAALRDAVGGGDFTSTREKMEMFRNAYGTVLFFEDQSVIDSLQEQFALYADNFPVWSLQSSGMLQFVIWTALEVEGFGASLQHYNPIIDADVQKEWNLPSNWKLLAQMPFGKPTGQPGKKSFEPLEDRVRFIK